MRLLYLTDRLSDRGGADHHFSQVISDSVDAGHKVTLAFGRDEGKTALPGKVELCRVPGLATRTDSTRRLGGLAGLLAEAEVVHVQNVMNPTALGSAVASGRAVVTVQDHRVFCPGQGKTLPDGSACNWEMEDRVCRECLPDDGYRGSTLELTRRRLAALRGAHVVVLSAYMANQLAVVGVDRTQVVPPWIEVGGKRSGSGGNFLLGGRLVEHKAVLDGWRAWDQAHRPLPLVIAGSGPLESDLEGTQRRGWLDPEGLRRELRTARALIFPARWQEPFGILGLEALAQGTPVVVVESGGTSEWSSAGCIKVAPGDVSAMSAAIHRLAAEPAWARMLGRKGQNEAAERFSRARIAPMLREIYRELRRS